MAHAFSIGGPTATQHLTRTLTANALPPGAETVPRMVVSNPVECRAAAFDQLEHHAPSRAIARKALRARGRELDD